MTIYTQILFFSSNESQETCDCCKTSFGCIKQQGISAGNHWTELKHSFDVKLKLVENLDYIIKLQVCAETMFQALGESSDVNVPQSPSKSPQVPGDMWGLPNVPELEN